MLLLAPLYSTRTKSKHRQMVQLLPFHFFLEENCTVPSGGKFSPVFPAVTKSGTGTWDLGREDSGTSGRGTRGRGDVGTWGRGDAGTRGRGDAGTWDSGTPGTPGRGTRGRGAYGLEDVINKQHLIFSLNLLITIFGALEKGINYAGEFVSRLVADDFQRPWFGLICLHCEGSGWTFPLFF